MFKDVYIKTMVLKQLLERQFIEKGMYEEDVEKAIEKMNAFLSLYKHKNTLPQEKLDIEQYNYQLDTLIGDLKIILFLLEDQIKNHFLKTKVMAETHIEELERKVKFFESLHKFEIAATKLGHTIFFKESGFKVSPMTDRKGSVVDLGEISTYIGKKLIAFSDIPDTLFRNVRFVFNGPEGEQYLSHHDHFREGLLVRGEREFSHYRYTTSPGQHSDMPVMIEIPGEKPNPDNEYYIYTGHNKIDVSGQHSTKYELIEKNRMHTADPHTEVKFWLIGGTKCNLSFTRSPIKNNFGDNNNITLKKGESRQVVFTQREDSMFKIETDAEIYATRYVPSATADYFIGRQVGNERVFLIESLKPGAPIKFNVFLEYQDRVISSSEIKYVAIKEV